MSYRSFKRVLGETNLERKCRFLFGACLLLLITGSFWWYGTRMEVLVTVQNETKGRLLADTALAIKHLKEFKLLGRDDRPAAVGEWGDYGMVLQNLSNALQNQQYSWRVITPDDDAKKPRDEFEWKLLDRFLKSPPPQTPEEIEAEYAIRPVPQRSEYEYFQAIRATKEACAICHPPPAGFADPAFASNVDSEASLAGAGPGAWNKPGPGHVIGIMEVAIPAKDTQKDLSRNRAILLATAIVTVFLAMVAAYVIVRYVIVKPLKHLHDVSDAISHGNIELRADIHTGDEFEELGMAFNRMLRHLVAAQEELRQANTNLDFKVDELAQLNMQLFEANRLKSDFLATMSHELRTPLNSIIGFSEVLGSIRSLDDKQRRYVQNIQTSGKMLLDMINDILDLAKIESGKSELRLDDFRIEQVIAAQCDMARPLTEKKNIDLEIDVEPNLPELHQDQGKVQQILNNLLSNAIKFTPDGGRITVTARLAGDDRMELIVADTGVGISEEDRATIFEKFRQGKIVLPSGDAMTREYSGTGLGLSIVKELCRLLGGEIHLESDLGKGSTFTVRFPWILPRRPEGSDLPMADMPSDMSRRPLDYPRLASTSAPTAAE